MVACGRCWTRQLLDSESDCSSGAGSPVPQDNATDYGGNAGKGDGSILRDAVAVLGSTTDAQRVVAEEVSALCGTACPCVGLDFYAFSCFFRFGVN